MKRHARMSVMVNHSTLSVDSLNILINLLLLSKDLVIVVNSTTRIVIMSMCLYDTAYDGK